MLHLVMSDNVPQKLARPIAQSDHIQGSLTASVVLVFYGNYQCLECGEAYRIVKAIQLQVGDALCFVFRHFSLIHQHPQARRAAEAAEAAGDQQMFWQMHDFLFENQPTIDETAIVEYARQLGLNMSRFRWNFFERVYRDHVKADFESGIESGVRQTPAFFINGFRHSQSWNFDTLLGAISSQAANTGSFKSE